MPSSASKKRPCQEPEFIEPMLVRPVSRLPEGSDWLYELKWDGYRALALKHKGRLRLLSRNNNDLSHDFPEVIRAIQGVRAETVLMDGEIVALEADGRPCFQQLQNRGSLRNRRLFFYAFDLLNLEGKDLRWLPLEDRKQKLEAILQNSQVRFSASLAGAPETIVQEVRRLKLEGVIAKRRDSVYQCGKRTGAWLKLKLNSEQEFLIGGYMRGGNPFESLLVGHYAGGKLIFAGKVRAGLTPIIRRSVWNVIKEFEQAACPFANLPSSKRGRWAEGVTAEDMLSLCWLRPQVIAQIGFTEWPSGGLLRHSTFVALREHKAKRSGQRLDGPNLISSP